ncbi:hypothetical protein AB205_0162290 [Aquarana catesbeiana]|uniref:Uncharacterized protein n=1 Tax=Aquarana catesbeiana TaxID=8400 RepID=A0A2G9QHZ2_AQUCT|nr:hypothetical protein AB205_0162290 [Aquarana catesbeiana]
MFISKYCCYRLFISKMCSSFKLALCPIHTIGLSANKTVDFCSKDVGSNLSCIHMVTQMLANNYDRGNVVTYKTYGEPRKRNMRESDLCTHDRKFRQQSFVGGKFENLLANICWRKVQQQMFDGAYTWSDFQPTSSHPTFVKIKPQNIL